MEAVTRIGSTVKECMVGFFNNFPEGDKILTEPTTIDTSKKGVNFAFLLFGKPRDSPGTLVFEVKNDPENQKGSPRTRALNEMG